MYSVKRNFFYEIFLRIEFLKNKPLSRYLKLLTKDILSFNHQQQAQILNILPRFEEPHKLTEFLIKRFDKFDEIQLQNVLITISKLGQILVLTLSLVS